MSKSIFKRFASILAGLALSVSMAACTQVNTGEVGVVTTFGKIDPTELGTGVHQSILRSVDSFSTKEILVEVQDAKPKSKDNLTMQDVDVDVYYAINPSKVADTLIKYQADVAKVGGSLVVGHGKVMRESREALFASIATFEATTMHTMRDDVSAAIQKRLQEQLNKTDPDVFIVSAVNVKSLVTDQAIEKSIRDRAQVDQQIEAKVKQEKLAEAEARRLKVEAEGQADANRILAESITPNLLRLKEIEAQTAIAAKEGNTTIMVPYGAQTQPMLSLR